jgi:hypothetical protein
MGMKEDMIMRAAAGKARGMMEPLLGDEDDEDTNDDDDTKDDDDDNAHKITAGQRLKMLVGKLTIMYYYLQSMLCS